MPSPFDSPLWRSSVADAFYAACDYRNSSFGLWVPILGILCDGRDFEFFVYDSSTRKFALSVQVPGLQQYPQRDLEFLRSIKRSS